MGSLSGGRKTSAWTNFQPDSSRSSAFSSSDNTRLYRTMSRCKFRTMIMATMTVKNNTINREFTILNQWTLSGTALSIDRYISHLEA